MRTVVYVIVFVCASAFSAHAHTQPTTLPSFAATKPDPTYALNEAVRPAKPPMLRLDPWVDRTPSQPPEPPGASDGSIAVGGSVRLYLGKRSELGVSGSREFKTPPSTSPFSRVLPNERESKGLVTFTVRF